MYKTRTIIEDVEIHYWEKSFRFYCFGHLSDVFYVNTHVTQTMLDVLGSVFLFSLEIGETKKLNEIKKSLNIQ
jgi:hypothetical protein